MLLQTFGCSFTYGEELPDPVTQAWPALLAQKLGYELHNYGLGGCGNNYMIKTAMKKVPMHTPDLVIVAWTSCNRMEFADHEGVYDIAPGWIRRFRKRFPHRVEMSRLITTYHNKQYQYRNWLRSVVLLQDFFKLRNVNYRFINAFDNQELNSKYFETSQDIISLLDTSKFIGWPDESMVEWTHKKEDALPRGPGGHPLEEGHQRIADVIFDAL